MTLDAGLHNAFNRPPELRARRPSGGQVVIVPQTAEPVRLQPRISAVRKRKVIDAAAREIRQAKPRFSRAVRETLEPGERVLGVARFHYMYTVYSFLVAGLLWALAAPLAFQLRLFSYYMVYYLDKFKEASANTDYMQWSAILSLVGEHQLAEIFALLAALKWMQMTGALGYDQVYLFFRDTTWWTVPAAACHMGATAFLVWRALRQWTTEILITDHRFIFKRGILIVRTLKTHLSHLSQIDVNQSWLGNLLGYGWVHIYTRAFENVGDSKNERLGVQEIFLPAIAKPHYFSSLIDVAKAGGKAKEEGAFMAPPGGGGPL